MAIHWRQSGVGTTTYPPLSLMKISATYEPWLVEFYVPFKDPFKVT